MPETAVNEHRQTGLRKDEIWLTFDLRSSSPASYSCRMHDFDEAEFGRQISNLLDATHDMRALQL